jgi:phosphoglycolate phosphatase
MAKDKFVLFDFDGVIADSFNIAYSVTAMNQPGLSEEEYRSYYEGNINNSKKKLDADFWERYVPKIKQEVKLFPHMPHIVRSMAQSYRLGIISSSVSDLISDVLKRESLDHLFETILGNDVHPSKVEKMKMMFEKYDTTPEECVFITDTLGDIREGEHVGVASIGVTWGFHSPEVLMRGSAFRLVNQPEEIVGAVSDYFTSKVY